MSDKRSRYNDAAPDINSYYVLVDKVAEDGDHFCDFALICRVACSAGEYIVTQHVYSGRIVSVDGRAGAGQPITVTHQTLDAAIMYGRLTA